MIHTSSSRDTHRLNLIATSHSTSRRPRREWQTALFALASSLAASEPAAALFFNIQPGLWSAATTWQGGAVPDGSDSVYLSHAVTLDVNFGPSAGGLYFLRGSLELDPGITLRMPDNGVIMYGGTSISGPGVIEGSNFAPLALAGGTVTSIFDVPEISVYTVTTGTVRSGTAINVFIEPSNILLVRQAPGQTDGLTIDGSIYFQFDDGTAKIALDFDPNSSLFDWGLRVKGDRHAYLTSLLGTQIEYFGTPAVEVLYVPGEDYTYVAAIPEPAVSSLLAASSLALLRRRRHRA